MDEEFYKTLLGKPIKGPENPKNRKRVLACYRNPTFYFSLY